MTVIERDDAPPPVQVRKVPTCRVCKGTAELIVGDGPPVCRPCIRDAGILGQATVRRSDTPNPEPRDGQWR